MTYDEALKILELNPEFTEEELKSQYRKQMRKWHPDICNNSNAEAMAKKINEAREILSKNIKIKLSNDHELEKLQNSFMKEIYKLYIDIKHISINKNNNNFIIFQLLNYISYIETVIKKCNNYSALQVIYDYYKESTSDIIKKYIKNYCEEKELQYLFTNDRKCIIDNTKTINITDDLYSIYIQLESINNNKYILKKHLTKSKSKFQT